MQRFSKKPVFAALILVAGMVSISIFLLTPADSGEEVAPAEESSLSSLADAAEMKAPPPDGEEAEPVTGDEFDVVFFAPWGSGEGQLGRREAEESDPAGPMGFVLDDAGRAAVLDQVNSRVVVFAKGRQVEEIGLPADTYQDLQMDDDGNLVLMDRLARRSVELFDRQGKPIARVDLEGSGVPEGGGTTALFLREDGVWVEVEHTRLVRVADARGRPDQKRPQVGGRFSADGAWLLSAAHLARFEEQAPFGVLEERIEAVLLGPDGNEIDRVHLPASRGALGQFRTLRFSPDGVLYHLYYDESGVSLRRVVL